MYGGGSSKLGRGGGRGGGGGGRNRSSYPPPPPPLAQNRPSTGRLSLNQSNPRNNNSNSNNNRRATSASATSAATEENFALVPGHNPPAFGMIIRLAPDLVDEIRRVENEGGSAKIRFDSIGTNPGGNIINVDGKEFRFTWSREFDDLCDIYEQQRSGEDGNGLLVESGCAWRKLNVQRDLDESMTNHVKMLSEEAERKNKSRKAIILDHSNPSMKNQLKQMAAVESNILCSTLFSFLLVCKVYIDNIRLYEVKKSTTLWVLANPWKNFKSKKEPPHKKQKVDPPSAPLKSSYKPGLTSTTTVRGGRSTSPVPSTKEQPGAPSPPFGLGAEDFPHAQAKGKDNATSSENEIPNRSSNVIRQTPDRRINFGSKPMDIQSCLVSLLKENPKGMSLKALEKAVGDTIPNSAKKIEPILKKIANIHAPGRYILKDLDGFKKTSSESGSSPEVNRKNFTPANEDSPDNALLFESIFEEKIPVGEPEGQAQMNSNLGEESYMEENPDNIHQQLFGEENVPENSEGKPGSSSDSDSDRDSDSSDSDSSRSRSASDSESDAQSNSKQGSDVDVDIIDDDKEQGHRVLMNGSNQIDIEGDGSDPIDIEGDGFDPIDIEGDGFDPIDIEGDGSVPIDIERDGSVPIDIEGDGSDPIDIEGNGSDVEIEKDFPYEEQESKIPNNEKKNHFEEPKPYSFDHDDLQERKNLISKLFDDKEEMFKDNINHNLSDTPEKVSKSKRSLDHDKKHEHSKKSKSKNRESRSTHNLSSNQPTDDFYRGTGTHRLNRLDGEGTNHDFGSIKEYNPVSAGKSSSDLQQSSRRSSEPAKGYDGAGKPNRYGESSTPGNTYPEKSSGAYEGFQNRKEKPSRDMQNEVPPIKEKNLPKNSKEGKFSAPLDSYRKPSGQISVSQVGFLPKDNIKTGADKNSVNGQSSILHRELSDLELGELREPFPGETPVKKQFEKKDSFKQSGYRPSASDSDFNRVKLSGKGILDNKKASAPNPNTGIGPMRPRQVAQSQPLPIQSQPLPVQSQPLPISRIDNPTNKSRLNEGGKKQGTGVEGYDESHKQAPASLFPQRDLKPGQSLHSNERKTQKSNTRIDFMDRRKDTMSVEGINGSRKMNGSDEDVDSSYSKYEKDEAELKGPIKDFIQYREYMHEYQDKYDSYCALDKILENYRNEFHEYGKELEFAKGRDTDKYYKIVEKRHKRLKKIFVVLHGELKYVTVSNAFRFHLHAMSSVISGHMSSLKSLPLLQNIKQRMKDFALAHSKD
ncbi:hypothetical protein ACFE04_003820 [Oxalis oulophora]